MNETTAVFLGIIIGVFLVLFCCAILFVYTKITKRIDSFKETERKAYTPRQGGGKVQRAGCENKGARKV